MMKQIRRYWADIGAQRWESLPAYFSTGAEIRWRNTHERFTVEQFVRANASYPGDWMVSIEREGQYGDTVVTAAWIWERSSRISHHVVSFFEFDESRKIRRLDEYWSDDGDPPMWRQQLEIGERY